MNVTQNASRCPPVVLVPCLIRNSRLFSMSNQRLLTLAEMFQVQGFPVFETDGIPFQCFWLLLADTCFFLNVHLILFVAGKKIRTEFVLYCRNHVCSVCAFL